MDKAAMNSILEEKAKNNDNGKAVVVRFPCDLYLEYLKNRDRMLSEAHDRGDPSNISIHSVVIEALRAFVEQ